jgi:hypothetical protein
MIHDGTKVHVCDSSPGSSPGAVFSETVDNSCASCTFFFCKEDIALLGALLSGIACILDLLPRNSEENEQIINICRYMYI